MSERENHERDPREMEPDYLVELAFQLHARACNPACSEALHGRANELKCELERRCERARIAEQEKLELVECLRWYEQWLKDCNRHGSEGNQSRDVLAVDRGERARALLAKHEATP